MSVEVVFTFEHLLEITGIDQDQLMKIINKQSFPVALTQLDEVVGWRSSEIITWLNDNREVLS